MDLRDEPLSVEEVLDALGDEAAGGLCLFVGRVRDHDAGKDVVGLDYTAHPSALEVLRAVAEEVAERHDVLSLAVVHRVGSLVIGDAAVVLAAAAAHRDTAFAASRDLIDTLKQRVPIWKHQRYADGSDTWVGSP